MGFHVHVYIVNHTSYHLTLNTYKAENGDIENSENNTGTPTESIPPNSPSTYAFTGKASGKHDCSGYVVYNLPDSGATMKITYSGFSKDGCYYSYNANAFVEIQCTEQIGYTNYLTTINPAVMGSSSTDDFDTTINVYPQGADVLITSNENHYGTPINISNRTSGWLSLQSYENVERSCPPTITDWTTSVGPQAGGIVLNYIDGTKKAVLTYNVSGEYVMKVIAEGTGTPPTVEWPYQSGPYSATVSPSTPGPGIYNVIVTEDV